MSLNPITREEKFLAKAGGEDVGELKPITRREQFLDRLAGGGGGASSWDDLKDKPFGETVEDVTITFNGSLEGYEFVQAVPNAPIGFVKISDLVPSEEDLIGGSVYMSDAPTEMTITSEDLEINEDGTIGLFTYIFIVPDYNSTSMPVTSNGVWVNYTPSMEGKIIKLKYTSRTIKTLDPKFLPAGGGGDVSWNDLTDKPFGDEWVEIFPETVVNYASMEDFDGIYGAIIDLQFDPSKINKLKVTYDGVDYENDFTAEMPFVGNLSIIGEGEDTGEPFLLGFFGAWCVVPSGSANNAKININSYTTKPLDPKYIPEYGVLNLNDILGSWVAEEPKTVAFNDFELLKKTLTSGFIKIKCSCSIYFNTGLYQGFEVNTNAFISHNMATNTYCITTMVCTTKIMIVIDENVNTLTAWSKMEK